MKLSYQITGSFLTETLKKSLQLSTKRAQASQSSAPHVSLRKQTVSRGSRFDQTNRARAQSLEDDLI